MSKFVVFDDFHEFGYMVAAPLLHAGHEVLVETLEDGPLDFERIFRFKPQALVLGLFRRVGAYNRCIIDWRQDIQGIEPLIEMERYPAVSVLPVAIFATGLMERDFPTSLSYDVFLTIPQDIRLYVSTMEHLVAESKSRRKIADFACPLCRSRLVYLTEPIINLFCPRCHASVAIADQETAYVMPSGARAAEAHPLETLQLDSIPSAK
jgi:uncharacterized protein YbaR (Trm112 family)